MSFFSDIFSSEPKRDVYDPGGNGAGTAFEADEDTQRRVKAWKDQQRAEDEARRPKEAPIFQLWDRLFPDEESGPVTVPIPANYQNPYANLY